MCQEVACMPLANTAIVWQLIHQELTLGYSASGMSIPSVGRFSFNFLRYSTDSVHTPATRSCSSSARASAFASMRSLYSSRFCARVGRIISSRRVSVPRGEDRSSAPPTIVGSQSKTTELSSSPITTASPARAPDLKSSSSTPSFARRSARYPTASSLLKSVC